MAAETQADLASAMRAAVRLLEPHMPDVVRAQLAQLAPDATPTQVVMIFAVAGAWAITTQLHGKAKVAAAMMVFAQLANDPDIAAHTVRRPGVGRG